MVGVGPAGFKRVAAGNPGILNAPLYSSTSHSVSNYQPHERLDIPVSHVPPAATSANDILIYHSSLPYLKNNV